jgi:predicted DNA-binding protein
MKRIAVFLTEKQIARLKELSDRDGLTVAEILRRAVDEYLAKMGA